MIKGKMERKYTVSGKIVSGAGEAAYFTQLEWVQKQCAEKLNFTPYPGTLNIQVDEGSLHLLAELQKVEGIELLSPDPTFCNARSLKASVGNVAGAIIIPAEDVQIHGKNTLEMIAPVSIKESLSLQDGDRVTVVIER